MLVGCQVILSGGLHEGYPFPRKMPSITACALNIYPSNDPTRFLLIRTQTPTPDGRHAVAMGRNIPSEKQCLFPISNSHRSRGRRSNHVVRVCMCGTDPRLDLCIMLRELQEPRDLVQWRNREEKCLAGMHYAGIIRLDAEQIWSNFPLEMRLGAGQGRREVGIKAGR